MTVRFGQASRNDADAVSTGDYWQITRAANPGYQLDLDEITFRIYALASEAGQDQIARFSKLEVIGDVVLVPEPASATLMLMGAVGLVTSRRRR